MVQLPPSQVHMGHFRVVVEIGNRVGERFVTIEALVDTGATYTWVPRDVLGTLGVVPDEEWPLILADGREVRYPRGWRQITIGGRAQPPIVVFGERGSGPIPGVVSLEGFRLAAARVKR